MEAVAFCSSVPVMQRDRLSSSFQASTRGSLQFGISEANISSFAVQKTICARSCLKTHISTDSEGLVRKSSLYNRRIIHTASCKLHLSRNDLTSRNQLQWKPFLYRTIKKTEFVDNNFISSRALPLAENIEVAPASDAVSDAGVDQDRVGVLLLNLGGPDTLDDVQPFLFNLFSDPDIIRLPRFFRFLQQPLAKFISVFRAPKSREGYAAIGGGSPLRKITYEQADALRLALEGKKTPAKVYVGMRYWYPFTEEAIEQIKRDKVTKLVVLPLYPQYSISTSGSSIRLLQSLFREDDYLIRLQHVIIASWYEREGYIQVMANLIEKELQSFVCAEKSRVGPVEWLKPYTDETIIELGQRGVKSLLAVPISFVSEHIETLEEIDMEYKELALESGIENWGRVPALGSEPAFISDLADAVIEALPNVKTMA
ncbi:ferrochelatase-2, chloroplastic isoform X2 [Cryptomeria japonica]|uniref:ferrochelatase-2, chloroplastic isoform X2 n=1 Tax=Cryptomeria japonica TaxID=3369 RepID=UPI0027D9DC61|nr:ferrochelatase-2, chloroplastic isoform X2 [Cryptomeria japonica]